MDVVALLPRQLLQHLTIVLGSQHSVAAVRGWDELRTVVHARVTDVIVVDPLYDGTGRTDAIIELHRQFPSLPIVVYPVSYTVWQAVDLAMRPPEPKDFAPVERP